ncbi:excalibur calcium-binding domain-containing protein [Caulobacter sp. BE264]|uniref:excalibur calcium-binding domain-containing protein n=1 Tax=Caulobacter sp. BE264 TaxID=2817724 RepID=UPI00385719E4
MHRALVVLSIIAGVGAPIGIAPAHSHPGGLNAEGCHNNRKTGDYHCHRAPAARPASSGTRPTSSAYFANCAEARAAGAAPIRVGEPGYRAGLDRDGDGVACER